MMGGVGSFKDGGVAGGRVKKAGQRVGKVHSMQSKRGKS